MRKAPLGATYGGADERLNNLRISMPLLTELGASGLARCYKYSAPTEPVAPYLAEQKLVPNEFSAAK
jgi:hypothetical protein